jgi:hypothetical protein
LKQRVRDDLGSELPGASTGEQSFAAGYSEGFVEANPRYRDDRFAGLLVFAEDSLDVYAFRVSTGEYRIFDHVPHYLIDTVHSFDALMSVALQRCLP